MATGPKPKPREELAEDTKKAYARIDNKIASAVNSALPVRYDVMNDEYIQVTQEWVTEIQRKMLEAKLQIKRLEAEKEMLEAMLKV